MKIPSKFMILMVTTLLYKPDVVSASEDIKITYAHAFDNSEIYDQTGLDTTDPKYQKRALKRLYNLKEKSLTRTLGIFLLPRLKTLESALSIGVKQNKLSSILGIMKGIARVITLPLQCIPLVGQYFGQLFDLCDGVSEIAGHSQVISCGNKYYTSIIPVLLKEILDIKTQIEALYKGIRLEKIRYEEEKYVQIKSKLSPELQESVEEALIKSRKDDNPFFAPHDFVKQALKLPITHKNLCKGITWGMMDQKFKEDPYFKTLDSDLRQRVYIAIKKAFFCSMSDDVSCMLRDTLFLTGNPGCGKTKLARYIVDFLGLPAYEYSLVSKSSIGDKNLYGGSWKFPGQSTLGITGEVFLKSKGGGGIFKNSVLIINDVHEIIKQGSAPSFFLNLLDPENIAFLNDFFEASIDWGRVLVILTSNDDLPTMPAVKASQNSGSPKSPETESENSPQASQNTVTSQILVEETKVSPLKERVTVIPVPDLKPEQVEESLLTLCAKYKKVFHTQTNISDKELIHQVFQQNHGKSMRIWMKQLIEKVVALDSDPNATDSDKVLPGVSVLNPQTTKPQSKLTFISSGDDVIAFKTMSGKQQWRQTFSGYEGVARLYYGKDAKRLFVFKNGYAWALNPRNGKEVWHNPLKGFGKSIYSTMAATGKKLFIGFNNYLLSLDVTDGNIKEYFKFEGGNYIHLSLHDDKLYAGVRKRYMFNPDQIQNPKQSNFHLDGSVSNEVHSLSVNNKYACFIYNKYLQVNDSETLVKIEKCELPSNKSIVVCDNNELDNIFVATKKKIQLHRVKAGLPVEWTYNHGAESLNLTKVSQNKNVLIGTRKRMIFALNPENGKEMWKYKFPDDLVLNDIGVISVLPESNGTLTACFNGNVVALSSSDGKQIWESIAWRNQHSLKSGMASMSGKPSNCDDFLQ